MITESNLSNALRVGNNSKEPKKFSDMKVGDFIYVFRESYFGDNDVYFEEKKKITHIECTGTNYRFYLGYSIISISPKRLREGCVIKRRDHIYLTGYGGKARNNYMHYYGECKGTLELREEPKEDFYYRDCDSINIREKEKSYSDLYSTEDVKSTMNAIAKSLNDIFLLTKGIMNDNIKLKNKLNEKI